MTASSKTLHLFGIKAWDAAQETLKAFNIKALTHKTPSNNIYFCDSSEPNKHWSKRLRFGEEIHKKIPSSGLLPQRKMNEQLFNGFR